MSIKNISKEAVWVIFGQLISVGGTLFLIKLLTKNLTVSQYGDLALGLSIGTLVTQVLMGGVGNGFSRYYIIAKDSYRLPAYLSAVLALLTRSLVLIFIVTIMIVILLWWAQRLNWFGLISWVMVYSALSGACSSLSGIQNAARHRIVVALHSSLDIVLRIMFSFFIFEYLGQENQIVVCGFAISSAIILCSQYYFFFKTFGNISKTANKLKTRYWISKIWSYSWPFSSWGIFTWIQQISDRWALEFFGNTSDVGEYVVAFQLGYAPINLLVALIASFLMPIIFEITGDGRDESRLKRGLKLIFMVSGAMLLGSVAAFLIAHRYRDFLFPFLVSSSFHEASIYWPWMILAGGFFATGQVLAVNLMVSIRTIQLTKIKILTATLGAILNIFGAWCDGIQGVVFSMVIFGFIYFICLMLSLKREYQGI